MVIVQKVLQMLSLRRTSANSNLQITVITISTTNFLGNRSVLLPVTKRFSLMVVVSLKTSFVLFQELLCRLVHTWCSIYTEYAYTKCLAASQSDPEKSHGHNWKCFKVIAYHRGEVGATEVQRALGF